MEEIFLIQKLKYFFEKENAILHISSGIELKARNANL